MRDFQTLLNEVVLLHGHLCAGQVLGVRMAMRALNELQIDIAGRTGVDDFRQGHLILYALAARLIVLIAPYTMAPSSTPQKQSANLFSARAVDTSLQFFPPGTFNTPRF